MADNLTAPPAVGGNKRSWERPKSGILGKPLPPIPVNESIEMDHSATEKTEAAKEGYYLPNTQPHIRMSRDSYFDDTASESSHSTAYDSGPEARAGPAFGGAPVETIDVSKKDGEAGPTVVNVPSREGLSYALIDEDGVRTNKGKTAMIMALLSEMWIIHIIVLIGGIFLWSFFVPQFYVDDQLWNFTCWWKLGWLFPLPYTIICFMGLVMPFRTPKFLYDSSRPKRRVDNLYILTVTKGDNREAVYRAWNAHKHLERLHPAVRIHVLTDEPYFFENINCYTCPKSFTTANSKYKARALEWYRQTMKFTEHDWVLHLDEESVIDDESVKRCLEFIWYEQELTWGQGVILYNQYRYFNNWFFTVADALRVGDDLARFHLQYTYFHVPVFGAHGSFLMTNGLVENAVTWDLGSLTEDYQFATHAWEMGFRCGKIPALIREQSPMDLMGFLKQRRRWYVGIRRLPGFLPKLWNAFWTLGILCLYGTIASTITGALIPIGTPRWFGFLKDVQFVTFIYLYVLGIFIEDLDKGVNPIIMVLRIPVVIVLSICATVLECMAVMYGLIFPPADFDVIKK
ncbi:hypothetical protein HK097_008674 [Rhizophlyctis rosea]|uniref:Glycosyltransferase 2-like domain-containing protein n=1 Tax=Rhizophlyctis rosea TaxID=64517 RepID=A0AAD5SBJ9_9FUNG|nr:hypothetical protein HK097_008674 [Rhizophlyctis rosea]